MPPDLNPVPDGTNGVVRRRDPAPVKLVKLWGWEIHHAPAWLVVVVVMARLVGLVAAAVLTPSFIMWLFS